MVRTSCPEKDTTCLHPEVEDAMRNWLRERNTPAFLLIGNPGVGKTTLAYRVCKQEKYFVQEFNASHTRTGSSFRDVIYPLLTKVGVTQWVQPFYTNGRAVVLDEMDGLSQGERGGLQELLDYLKSKRNFKEDRPLILICNIMEGKLMQQLYKYCTVKIMNLPKKELLQNWFGRFFPEELYTIGDIRKFVQYMEKNSEDIVTYKETFPTESKTDSQEQEQQPQTLQLEDSDIHIAIQAAWYTLKDTWKSNEELDLETKDANLAGLLYHQNIPTYFGQQDNDGGYYNQILKLIYISDRADFWAFFHQCWNLLSLSYEIKLKIPNQCLSQFTPRSQLIQNVGDLQYTQVLTKQSALFNAWKEINKHCDKNQLAFRFTTQWANLQNDKKIVETIGLPSLNPKKEYKNEKKKARPTANTNTKLLRKTFFD